MIFKKYKTFFRVDIQLYQHKLKLEKQEIVCKKDARRAQCFHIISSFPNFHDCQYNCILARENVLKFLIIKQLAMSKARTIQKISPFTSAETFPVYM